MATAKPKLRDRDVQGLKYFTQLQPLLVRLHEVGGTRDKAGNRELTMDRCLLIQRSTGRSPTKRTFEMIRFTSSAGQAEKSWRRISPPPPAEQ